jgi:mono/diheme cytochrome c family protein
MKKLLISLTAIGIACALSFGQSSREKWTAPARAAAKKNPVTVNDTSIALGKKIYERQCLACHGAQGRGDGPVAAHLEKRPGNLSSPELWEQSDGALFWKVNEGHKPMPTFKHIMSDEERWPVINYIRTLAPQPVNSDETKRESKP